jgi:hypothetical protein
MTEITTPIDPGMTTTIVYTDPQVVTTTIIIPPGAVSESITLVFTPNPTPTHPISDGLPLQHSDLDAYLDQRPCRIRLFRAISAVSATPTRTSPGSEPGSRLLLTSAWADRPHLLAPHLQPRPGTEPIAVSIALTSGTSRA